MSALERAHTPLNLGKYRICSCFVRGNFANYSWYVISTLYKLVIQKKQPIPGQAEHCVLHAYSYRWSMTGPLWYAFVTIVNITFRLIAPLSACLYRGFNIPVARKFLHVKSMICLAWSLYPILCYSNNFLQLQKGEGPARRWWLRLLRNKRYFLQISRISPCWDASYTWPMENVLYEVPFPSLLFSHIYIYIQHKVYVFTVPTYFRSIIRANYTYMVTRLKRNAVFVVTRQRIKKANKKTH